MTKRSTKIPVTVVHRTATRIVFDNGMYLVALITPILTIPQLLTIWVQHQAGGVSQLTWAAYAVMSGVWLIYGLLQRQKPLVLSQACLFVVDFAVVLGISIFRS